VPSLVSGFLQIVKIVANFNGLNGYNNFSLYIQFYGRFFKSGKNSTP